MKRILSSVCCLVFVMFCSGCGTSYGTYNISVVWDDPSKQPGAFDVDVFAVRDEAKWKSMSVDKYCSPDSADRRNARNEYKALVFRFNDKAKGPFKVDANKWDAKWRDQNPYLVIIADLRWITDRDDPAGANPSKRRWIMPLDTKRWDTKNINVRIRADGLQTPEPLQEKK